MLTVLNDPATTNDRRSSNRRSNSIRFGPRAHGVARAEVHLTTYAFEPHRHDTYAIGVTTAGVQTFRDRGMQRVCLPGQLHVLARTAAEAGFADQSHMTRQFKQTYGFTPARWAALTAAPTTPR